MSNDAFLRTAISRFGTDKTKDTQEEGVRLCFLWFPVSDLHAAGAVALPPLCRRKAHIHATWTMSINTLLRTPYLGLYSQTKETRHPGRHRIMFLLPATSIRPAVAGAAALPSLRRRKVDCPRLCPTADA